VPELPEVESVRRELEREIVGRTIAGAQIFDHRLREPVARDLGEKLAGARIVAVARRAKYLLIETSGPTLVSHLGMTGSWRLEPAAFERRKHDHVAIDFRDGAHAVYHDPRRFGLLVLTPYPGLDALGIEPLSAPFTGTYLQAQFAQRKAPVKALLMDQRVVVGVGNIYAAEALFRAGIAPQRMAGRLTRARCEALTAAVKKVLREAIAEGGSTTSDYRRVNGESGRFQHAHRVYARAGAPCLVCGTPIRTRMIGGRSSFHCPKCQR
jgi:formamidopyrimidine-DNA glycosylase